MNELTSRLESSLLDDPSAPMIQLSRETANAILAQLVPPMCRERTVVSVCDEDLEGCGYEPEKISDERFQRITEIMAEYFDDSFQSALFEAIEGTVDN